jgi:hypothetical protein
LSKSRSFGRAASPGRGYPAATTLCPGYTSAKAADEPKRNISSKAFNGLHDISKLAVTFFSTRKGTHTQLPFYPLLSFVAEGPFQVAYDSPVRVKKQLEEWWDISASHFSSVIYRTERPGKFSLRRWTCDRLRGTNLLHLAASLLETKSRSRDDIRESCVMVFDHKRVVDRFYVTVSHQHKCKPRICTR